MHWPALAAVLLIAHAAVADPTAAAQKAFTRAEASVAKSGATMAKLSKGTEVKGLLSPEESETAEKDLQRQLSVGDREVKAASYALQFKKASSGLKSQVAKAKDREALAVQEETRAVKRREAKIQELKQLIVKLKEDSVNHNSRDSIQRMRAILRAQAKGVRMAIRKAKASVERAQMGFDAASKKVLAAQATAALAAKKARKAVVNADVDAQMLQKEADMAEAAETKAVEAEQEAKANLEEEKEAASMQKAFTDGLAKKDKRVISLADEANTLEQQAGDYQSQIAALELSLSLTRQEQEDADRKKAIQTALKLSINSD